MKNSFDKNFALLLISQTGFFISLFLTLSIIALYSNSIGVSEDLTGVIVGIFSFSAVISRYPFGKSADRGGRKKFLLIGAGIFVVSSFIYPFSEDAFVLLLVRAFHGVGIGAYMVASMSKLVDLVPQDRLGEAMGWFGVPIMVAMVIGQGGGPLFVDLFGFDYTFYLAGFFAIFSLIIAFPIKETKIENKQEASFLDTLKDKNVFSSSFGTFMLTFVYGGFISFYPLFLEECFLKSELEISIGFLAFAIASLVARPIFGRFSDSIGKTKVIAPGMIAAATGLWLLGGFYESLGFYYPLVLFGGGFGAAYAVLSALSVETVSKFQRGKATAILTSGFDLGLASGSSLLGFLAGGCNFSFFFLTSSVILFVGVICFSGMRYFLLEHSRVQN